MKFKESEFELMLFTTNTELAKESIAYGINGIFIDWENKDKDKRQEGFSTQINYDSPEDLKRMRTAIDATILCRLNKFNPAYSSDEINTAIDLGADELLFPMVESPAEIEAALHIINGRIKTGMLIETDRAATHAASFAHLPLSRIYIGLNDLHISSKSAHIFDPLTDGTVAQIKSNFKHIPIGVGGITHPHSGNPVPATLLMQQYAQLNMNFSFLRRSFLKDVQQYGLQETLTAIRTYLSLLDTSLYTADHIASSIKALTLSSVHA
ncbi:MAG: hypothetical protein ACOYKE_11890 [Ferruginibacter sp.]